MSEARSEELPPEESRGAVVDWITNTFDPWLESKKASNTLIIVCLLLAAIPIIGVGLATTRTILPYDQIRAMVQLPFTPSSSAITAVFKCPQNKSITATFLTSSVDLSLSDGRHLTLPHAISADGARYANPDESFVFWNKGDTAFIQEGGKTTYSDCVTNG